MDLEHFKTFTTDDFILDDDFREIVRNESNGQLKELLESLPDKRQEIILAKKIIGELRSGKYLQNEKRKQELWQQVVQKQSRKKIFLYFRYAASLLLLIGIGSAVFYISKQDQAEKIIVANESQTKDAILILADGKSVSINSKQSKIQYSEDGSGIMVNDTSDIAQKVSGEGFNQLIVPYGKRSFITLSEGTKVWLNSGSKLIFPPAFKGKTREVILEGEAFFDVTHNPNQPFYVRTDAFKMKVYGTKFNVQAYQQDKGYSIVLVEGKVSMNANTDSPLKETFLAPNQKATIIKGDKIFDISVVENMEVYTAWIDGYLTFINEDVSDLLVRVSRYYNVPIETKLSGDIEKIYGKLDMKDDLERVLDGIAFISKTKYIKQGEKFVFYE